MPACREHRTGHRGPLCKITASVASFCQPASVSQPFPHAEHCHSLMTSPEGEQVDLIGAVTTWPHALQVSIPCDGECLGGSEVRSEASEGELPTSGSCLAASSRPVCSPEEGRVESRSRCLGVGTDAMYPGILPATSMARSTIPAGRPSNSPAAYLRLIPSSMRIRRRINCASRSSAFNRTPSSPASLSIADVEILQRISVAPSVIENRTTIVSYSKAMKRASDRGMRVTRSSPDAGGSFTSAHRADGNHRERRRRYRDAACLPDRDSQHTD